MNLIHLYFDTQNRIVSLDVSPWLLLFITCLAILILLLRSSVRKYRFVKLNISLGGIGNAEFKPNTQDLQIAHQIWTELVTRKAAIPVDPDHDVIVEIYDSWYSLFKIIRELIASLPADLVRKEKSTQEIVRIATTTLNNGLRPHLTKWQARFRNWYQAHAAELKKKTPQELQQEYPEFSDMIADMLLINKQLISYAAELKKLLGGS